MLALIPVAANSPKPSIEIGSLVGEYKVTSLRSDGERAKVYRAEHTRFLRQAAIKLFDVAITDASVKAGLEDLLGRISQVRHANVAELYDFGYLESGQLYLVLEWVDGYGLDDPDAAIRSQSVEDKFSFLQSIASAIDEVHLLELTLPGLDDAHVLVESKRGRAKLIAYGIRDAVDALALLASTDDDDSSQAESSQVADYGRLGSMIERLLLNQDTSLDDETIEKLEVVIARCRTGEASDAFGSGSALIRELKASLGLEEPKTSTLAIGTLVGESYKVTGVIGKGGMGQVYEGVHVRLPQRVAIKVIDGSFTEEANIRFRQEAEIAASLGHPHLVRIIDFNTFEDGRPYMVMEYLEGEDLGKIMRHGPLSPKRAVEIARQVGSALSAVHKKGIVHRDLKPPNVFLGTIAVGGEVREHATVLDFGVSKREDATISVTKTSAVVGTPQYMAPEQALGENDTLTAKADQFSLGSLLYEMLSGAPAFGRGTLAEVVYRVCQEEPPPLKILFPDLPASVSDAVQRAMSKRAEDRYDSVANFVAALSQDELSETTKGPALQAKADRAKAGASDTDTAATVANRKSDVALPPVAASAAATVAASASTSEVAPTVAAGSTVAVRSRRPTLGMALALVAALGAALLAFVIFSGQGSKKETAKTAKSGKGKSAIALASVNDAAPGGPADAAEKQALPIPGDAVLALALSPVDAGVAPAPDANLNLQAKTSKKPHAVPEAALPKEITAKLDEADRLIKAGRYPEARRLISRDKRAAATRRGPALVVKSFCGESNFGAAQDWLNRVPKADRREVIAYCKTKHQIELN